MLIIKSRMVGVQSFEHMVQSYLSTCLLVFVLGATLEHIVLECSCLIKISNQTSHVYLNKYLCGYCQ